MTECDLMTLHNSLAFWTLSRIEHEILDTAWKGGITTEQMMQSYQEETQFKPLGRMTENELALGKYLLWRFTYERGGDVL